MDCAAYCCCLFVLCRLRKNTIRPETKTTTTTATTTLRTTTAANAEQQSNDVQKQSKANHVKADVGTSWESGAKRI